MTRTEAAQMKEPDRADDRKGAAMDNRNLRTVAVALVAIMVICLIGFMDMYAINEARRKENEALRKETEALRTETEELRLRFDQLEEGFADFLDEYYQTELIWPGDGQFMGRGETGV